MTSVRRFGSSSIVETAPLTFASNGVARPFVASTAATLRRDLPPIEANSPATYTGDPDGATRIASTVPSQSGFHFLSRPVRASTPARLARSVPSTVENDPAM